jgi:hypothetical protein
MRLHFTIRDLLWLTAVVALALGWWLDHQRIESSRYMQIIQDHGRTLLQNDNTGEQWENQNGNWVLVY